MRDLSQPVLSVHVALGWPVGEEQVPSAALGVEDLGWLVPVTPMQPAFLTTNPPEAIGTRIHVIRGVKVMFDFDNAELYGVPTKALNQGVKRNRERFPEDFMFQLTTDELENWRSQIVTSNLAVKMGLRRPPYAFTEHRVTMLASVLKSDQAAQMSIRIVRAFVQLREMLAAHRDLTLRVDRIEQQQHTHASVIEILAEEIDNLKLPQAKPFKQPIGFKVLASGGGEVA